MPKLVRSLITLGMLAGCVWFTFAVPLGQRTLAQHLDRIGQTPEAEALRKGAQQRLTPAMQEVEDRLLGEYVEAPTELHDDAPLPDARTSAPRPVGERSGGHHASTAEGPKLPGRR